MVIGHSRERTPPTSRWIGRGSASRIGAATNVVSATAPNRFGNGKRSKKPPANPASLFPMAIERNHTPIIAPTILGDRKSTRLNSSHGYISYAVFCLKKKKKQSVGQDSCRNFNDRS